MNSLVKLWSIKRILKHNRLRSCLILMALVMAPLVVSLIFSESMMDGITSKYIYLSDGHIQIHGSCPSIKEDLPEMVSYLDPVTTGYVLLYSSTGTSSVTLKGVTEDYFNASRSAQLEFQTNPEIGESNLKPVVISKKTAQTLKVNIGDKVAMMVVPDTAGKVIRPVIVRVEAIFSSGYDQLDQLLSFTSADYSKTLFSNPDSTSYELLATNAYSENLGEVIQSIHALYPGAKITTWDQFNTSVYQNFVTSKQMILIVFLLISTVAAFYTASVAQQMIGDDIKDIAIMKLAGSSDKIVKQSAFLSVYSVTVAGIIVGLIAGLLLGCNLGPLLKILSSLGLESLSFYLLNFDTFIPWHSILLVIASLLIISSISIRLALAKTKAITPMELFRSV